MKKDNLIANNLLVNKTIAVVLTMILMACSNHNSHLIINAYTWENARTGGGGFIVGLLEDPQNDSILYARNDVGGIFKSTNAGETWTAVNNGCKAYYHHQVQSFAISPHNSNILFRCSGSASNHKTYGDIMKTIDGGKHWYVVTDDPDFIGNGDTRFFGEVIQVDPFNVNSVIAGSFSKGVFLSTDGGEHWKNTGLNGQAIGCVYYDPLKRNKVYVGIRRSFQHMEYLTSKGKILDGLAKLYCSEDGGLTWKLIYSTRNYDFNTIAIDPENTNLIYASSNREIIKSTDGGKTFTVCLKGLISNGAFFSVKTNPSKPGMVYTAMNKSLATPNAPLLPLMVSFDSGQSWKNINTDGKLIKNYPAYIGSVNYMGCGIARFLINNKNSAHMYFSNCYGVFASNDGGHSWDGHGFKGLSTICLENVQNDPFNPGTSYITGADIKGFKSADDGRSYQPVAQLDSLEVNCGTAICLSMHQKGFIMSSVTGRSRVDPYKGTVVIISSDGGNNFSPAKYFPNTVEVRAIKEDHFMQGTFYVYADGAFDDGAGLYVTKDWGKNFSKLSSPFPAYIRSGIPYRKDWIESELLPIVFYQKKNVCGADQILATDPFNKNTIYVGEWTEGLFKSSDGGQHWILISKGLPFHKNNDTVTTLVDIKCDPNHRNTLYTGFVKAGLWRSEDAGQHWKKIFPVTDIDLNASSTFVGGVNKDELFTACEPSYYSKAPSAIYHSADLGKTWVKISDNRFGALRWKSISVNTKTGTIIAVTNGNGCFRGQPN